MWLLVAGCWLLAVWVCCWLLVVGLIVGCWLLLVAGVVSFFGLWSSPSANALLGPAKRCLFLLVVFVFVFVYSFLFPQIAESYRGSNF